MFFFIRFWSSLNKKDSVESAKYDILKNSTSSFFRIRTQEKRFDPDLEKNLDPKHCFIGTQRIQTTVTLKG